MEKIEKIYISGYKSVPNIDTNQEIRECITHFENIKLYLKERPSTPVVSKEMVRTVLCKINQQISYDEAIDYINSQNGIFPNADGLFMIDAKTLSLAKGTIYGFDVASKLWEPFKRRKALFVPFIRNGKGDRYFGLSAFGEKAFKAKNTGSYLIYFINS